ncbi:hypothetical protein HZS_8029 [Henneguya salminicola]|nr:hypothetical protein HZS_8029 [Henneguya salminicola]
MIVSQNTGVSMRNAEVIHSNHIESRWHALKLSLSRTDICYFIILFLALKSICTMAIFLSIYSGKTITIIIHSVSLSNRLLDFIERYF